MVGHLNTETAKLGVKKGEKLKKKTQILIEEIT